MIVKGMLREAEMRFAQVLKSIEAHLRFAQVL